MSRKLYYVENFGRFSQGFRYVPKHEAQFWVDTLQYAVVEQNRPSEHLNASDLAFKIQKELK